MLSVAAGECERRLELFRAVEEVRVEEAGRQPRARLATELHLGEQTIGIVGVREPAVRSLRQLRVFSVDGELAERVHQVVEDRLRQLQNRVVFRLVEVETVRLPDLLTMHQCRGPHGQHGAQQGRCASPPHRENSLNRTRKKMEYNTGTTPSVRTVANRIPKMIATAIG